MRVRSDLGRRSLPLLAAVAVAAAVVGCSDAEPVGDAEPPPNAATLSDGETTTPESSPPPPPPRSVGFITAEDAAPEPEPDEDDDAPSNVRSLTALQVGDCVDLPVSRPTTDQSDESDQPDGPAPANEEVDFATLIPCDEPHDAEVYARISLDDDPAAEHPGDEAVLAGADRVCLAAFEGYVGVPYVDTDLEIVHLRPNAAAWIRGDRLVVCTVISIDLEPLTGRVGSEP